MAEATMNTKKEDNACQGMGRKHTADPAKTGQKTAIGKKQYRVDTVNVTSITLLMLGKTTDVIQVSLIRDWEQDCLRKVRKRASSD
jgi:hypothetical protein